MSQTAVSRIWRAFGLRPHDRHVQALLRSGFRREGARCRWPVPRTTRSRAGAVRGREAPDPSRAGPARAIPLRRASRGVTHDYRRHGTLDLFAAPDVKAGTVIGCCEPRHRSVESASSWSRSEQCCAGPGGVLVLDNLKTHKTQLIHDCEPPRVSWRLLILRGWSHDEANPTFSP